MAVVCHLWLVAGWQGGRLACPRTWRGFSPADKRACKLLSDNGILGFSCLNISSFKQLMSAPML